MAARFMIHERLVKGREYLERLDQERTSRGEPLLGKSIEERIIWRELLDLELQEFDEQIERICHAADHLLPGRGHLA
jgi:hypothetical protein